MQSLGQSLICGPFVVQCAALLEDLHDDDVVGALESKAGVFGDDLATFVLGDDL